ncbi:MAG: hypothetical protein R2778_09075 [Saprospiraceae bacterium]
MSSNKSFIAALIILLNHATARSQHTDSANLAKSDTIPFVLTAHNNMSIKAVLNHTDTVYLMFHTAASGITIVKDAAEKTSSVKWDQSEHVSSWGGENESRYSAVNSLQIGRFQWDSLSIWEDEHSGPGTDGKFGPDLFAHKVIELDFDNSQLIIHQYLPERLSDYEKLTLIFENGFYFLEAKSLIGGQIFPNRFLIHSGFGGAILYDDQFVEESKIGEQITITKEQELKDSFGNIIKTKKGKLPELQIGKLSFKDVPVGFFEGSIGRQKMSVLGGGLLKRFNLMIDAEREFIYIKLNTLAALPFKDS